jgi:hypothetical protein
MGNTVSVLFQLFRVVAVVKLIKIEREAFIGFDAQATVRYKAKFYAKYRATNVFFSSY